MCDDDDDEDDDDETFLVCFRTTDACVGAERHPRRHAPGRTRRSRGTRDAR